jgi:hypothetical protein
MFKSMSSSQSSPKNILNVLLKAREVEGESEREGEKEVNSCIFVTCMQFPPQVHTTPG